MAVERLREFYDGVKVRHRQGRQRPRSRPKPLDRIAELYAIEKTIRGMSCNERRGVDKSQPLVPGSRHRSSIGLPAPPPGVISLAEGVRRSCNSRTSRADLHLIHRFRRHPPEIRQAFRDRFPSGPFSASMSLSLCALAWARSNANARAIS